MNEGSDKRAVFVGTFVHSLDPKRRVTVPSGWRDEMRGEESLFVLPGVDEPCLSVMPAREMTERLEAIGHHSMADRKAQRAQRVLASRSDLINWDSQGRVRINDDLLKHAGIEDKVVMIGNFRFFEMWNPAKLKEAGVLDDADLGDAVRHVGF